MNRRSALRSLGRGIVGVALSAASLAIVVHTFPLTRYPEEEVQSTAPHFVEVIQQPTDRPSPARARLTWTTATSQTLGSLTGVVRSVAIEAGLPIDCGDALVTVNEITVSAYCGPGPLWREIDARTQGPDALELLAFLAAQGFLDPAVDASRTAIDRAIRAYQLARGNVATGRLGPQQLLWIESPVTPTSVTIAVGDILAPGDELWAVDSRLASAAVEEASPPGRDDTTTRVLGLDGSSVRFAITDDLGVVDLPGFEAEVRSQIDEGDLPTEVAGTTRDASERDVAAVPAGSVVTGPSATCVYMRTSTGTRPVDVVVVDSAVSQVLVIGDLRSGDEVLANPDRAQSC